MIWFKKRKEIELIQSMQKLDIKDGDVLVIKHPYYLKYPEVRAASFDKAMKGFGFDVKVLLLEAGEEIGILRKEDMHGTHVIIDKKSDGEIK